MKARRRCGECQRLREELQAARGLCGTLKANVADHVATIRGLEEQLAQARAVPAPPPPVPLPERRRLPDTHDSMTYKLRVGRGKELCPTCGGPMPGSATSCHLHVGFYPDKKPGEVFIQLDRFKRGDLAASFAHALAIAISIALQHGVPLGTLLGKFLHARDETAGVPFVRTNEGEYRPREDYHHVASLLDYIARVLEAAGGGAP